MRTLPAIFAIFSLCGCEKPPAPLDLSARQIEFPNGAIITAVPAQTQIEILRGLRFYDTLAPDRGMLFIYAKPDKHPFWMYQAKFPVDILWLDADHKIVEMSSNTPPCPSTAAHECPTFGGQKESRFVLELKAGVAAQNGLHFGDRLTF